VEARPPGESGFAVRLILIILIIVIVVVVAMALMRRGGRRL
jgi:flagellar basal body-associated protein FliL